MSRKKNNRRKRRKQVAVKAWGSAVAVEQAREEEQPESPALAIVETSPEPDPYVLPLVFSVADFRSTAIEAIHLIKAHGEELGLLDMPWPFKPALNLVRAACEAGLAVWFTAREREHGTLVGYALYALSPGQFFRETLCASREWIYLDPSHRIGKGLQPLAYRFLQFCDAEMERRGVGLIEQTAMRGTGFGRMLTKAGYRPVEDVYWKHIEQE